MQGRGVTNFSADKPSHALTPTTTEFDDALLQRGIVTMEQVMLAKGASPEEALRLARENKGEKEALQEERVANTRDLHENNEDGTDSDDLDDSFDDDGDDFFSRYRQERLAQLKNNEHTICAVEHISREEWSEKVNETSMDRWVLVILLDKGNRRQEILQELHNLARRLSASAAFSIVTIEATEAVQNWPSERVPALFAYRDGVKKEEWITTQNGKFPNCDQLEELLREWDIILD
jgi:hypothetical protein